MSAVSETGASAPVSPPLRRRRSASKWRHRRLVLVLLSPWIVGFAVFIAYPLVMSVYLSFTHYDLLNAPRWIGVQRPHWFTDPGWAKPPLVSLGVWGIVKTMVIFLTAVLDVPRHLYESADLDGACPWQRRLYVTIP